MINILGDRDEGVNSENLEYLAHIIVVAIYVFEIYRPGN